MTSPSSSRAEAKLSVHLQIRWLQPSATMEHSSAEPPMKLRRTRPGQASVDLFGGIE
jgi:hypothetical protein